MDEYADTVLRWADLIANNPPPAPGDGEEAWAVWAALLRAQQMTDGS